jgi:mutator protein MutT
MKTVCAAIIREKGMILVSTRPEGKAAEGKWEFPGGKVEPGESFGECIIREMREELALEVIPLDVVFDIIHHYPAGAIRLVFLRCLRKDKKEPEAKEGQTYRWIPLKGLRDLDFLEADKALCELLIPSEVTEEASKKTK